MDVDNDLYIANLINNACTTVNNMKGKVTFPREIRLSYLKSSIVPDLTKASGAYSERFNNIMLNSKYKEEYKKSKNMKEFNRIIFHELGHCNHHANCTNANKMGTLAELKIQGIKDTHFTEEFFKDIRNNNVIREFHREYGLSSPAEFIADTFACKMLGISIPKEVEEIYLKYGGIPFPR